MANIVERSFKINITVMSAMGLYPTETTSLFSRIKAYGSYLLFAVMSVVLAIMKTILERKSDIVQMNFTMMYIVEILAICFKLLPFYANGERIKRCILYFADPRFAPKDEEETKIVNECIGVCRRNSLSYLVLLIVGEFFWIVPRQFIEKKLPLDIWLPHDFETSNTVVFYATCFYTSAALVYNGLVTTILDPLIGSLAYHATSQLKILKYNLQNLGRNIKSQSHVRYKDVYKKLKSCVDHHNDILNFVDEYESCFSYSLFCQFSGTLLGVCFCLIGLTMKSGFNTDTATTVVSLMLVLFQILFYCHYGTLLFEENNGLTNAIYMGDWYKYDVKIRKVLIAIMERSRRPLVVTSGKIIDVTLQTYASVLKMSYSLVAVFKKYQ